jgi:hypothetical protein
MKFENGNFISVSLYSILELQYLSVWSISGGNIWPVMNNYRGNAGQSTEIRAEEYFAKVRTVFLCSEIFRKISRKWDSCRLAL